MWLIWSNLFPQPENRNLTGQEFEQVNGGMSKTLVLGAEGVTE